MTIVALVSGMTADALKVAAQSPSVFASRHEIPVSEALTAISQEIDFRKRNPRFRRM